MIELHRNVRKTVTIAAAVASVAMAFLWPNWREELRAQGYTLFSPSITIDICEVNQVGAVTVGGKVGEDARIGQTVFVSRGATNQSVATVLGNGTYEGSTTPGFAQPGQLVTVGIPPIEGKGGWLSTCQLGASVGNRR